MSELLAVTIVEDISHLCSIKEGESPLYVRTFYPNDVGTMTLEEFAQHETIVANVPKVAYAVSDRGLIEFPNKYYESSMKSQRDKIVMGHYYEEV